MNYYQRHVGDYAKDAGHLSLMEHGVYSLLLDRYYASEKPITKVDAMRIAHAKTDEERGAVETVLAEFFTQDGDLYRSKRADEEIEKYLIKAETNRGVGKLGGRPRKTNNPEITQKVSGNNPDGFQNITQTEPTGNPDHNPDVTQNEPRNNPSHKPLTNKKKNQKKGAVAPIELPSWLDPDIWSDWHNYRNSRKGWTPQARQLSLATLADLYAQGHDPRSVVNKSIECGWTGLFALKQANAPPGHRPSQPSKTFAAIQLLEDMKNGQLGTSSNLGRVPEASLLELGPDSGDGHDPGYGSRVA